MTELEISLDSEHRNLPIVVDSLKYNTESHDNPFTADGELSKKAEYIIRHSKISRSEILISDPDLRKTVDDVTPEEIIVSESTALVESAPPPPTSNDVSHSEKNGQVENSVVMNNNKQIEAEVSKSCASSPPPQQAEQVKLKDSKKCKCCIVQ